MVYEVHLIRQCQSDIFCVMGFRAFCSNLFTFLSASNDDIKSYFYLCRFTRSPDDFVEVRVTLHRVIKCP